VVYKLFFLLYIQEVIEINNSKNKLSTISNTENKTFNENGYIVRKNVIQQSLIESVINTFIKFCIKLGGKQFDQFEHLNSLDCVDFNRRLLDLREKKPLIFGAIYDTMQTTLSMQKIALSKNILKDVCKLLDAPMDNLMCFNYLFRMDPPMCNRNKLDWHQDFITYDQVDMSDGLTAWIPLIDIPQTLGPLKALKKSHLDGKAANYDINQNISIDKLSSHKHNINKDIIDKYTSLSLPVELGDVIYISMNLIHASGDNISNKIRFSGQGRFYNILSDTFPPGRTQFMKSKLF
tara:strand:+ start:27 stop:902 length:876 start_codon:yes stop_codon:yes gene_type:complete